VRLRPQRLVLIGSVLIDILMYVERLPERGGDALAQRSMLTSGGGFNVLAGAARLGMPASYAGRVGDGPMGAQVLRDLQSASVPLLLLPQVAGDDTGFDIALVEHDAERTFVTSPGTEARLTPHDLAAIPLAPGDAVYVSGYDLAYRVSGASLGAWLPTLAPENLLVIDPGPLVIQIPYARMLQALARADILSLNAREIRLFTGIEDVASAASTLAPRVAPDGWVVARDGPNGCWLASRATSPQHIPPRPTHAVDTTGAGDTHVAAMLARLAAGDEIAEAVRVANVASSLSVERPGPATGPTSDELAQALAAMG
jgi:sugar/nucleoside kinase (ribokinase family)